MKRFQLTLMVIILAVSAVCAQPAQETRYVASTSWVASIAELAGADNVSSIAPAELKHPPEYEITPQDIAKVAQAELFMYAGYEKMMKTIGNAAEVNQDKILHVTTTNTLNNLKAMVTMISEKTGTQAEASKRFGAVEQLFLQTRKAIKDRGLDKLTVYVNKNQAQFAKDLGLNVVDTFGPAPFTSDQIAQAAKDQYDLIIDNVHNPVAAPALAVSPGSVLLVWRNFPDHIGNNALYQVLKDNTDSLLGAF